MGRFENGSYMPTPEDIAKQCAKIKAANMKAILDTPGKLIKVELAKVNKGRK